MNGTLIMHFPKDPDPTGPLLTAVGCAGCELMIEGIGHAFGAAAFIIGMMLIFVSSWCVRQPQELQ